MQTPEHKVAAVLKSAAQGENLFIRKCRWEGHIGAPDYLILKDGRAFFVETKAPGQHPRPSQTAEFTHIRRNGCPVYVVDSAETARAVVAEICGTPSSDLAGLAIREHYV